MLLHANPVELESLYVRPAGLESLRVRLAGLELHRVRPRVTPCQTGWTAVTHRIIHEN